MANLAGGAATREGVAARAILIAVLANTVTKAGMALFMGEPRLRRVMLPISALLLAAGVLAVALL